MFLLGIKTKKLILIYYEKTNTFTNKNYKGKGLNKWNINPNCNLKNMFMSTHVRRIPIWYIE